ncbi:MAG: hypothetical protein HY842_03000 [Bacteroidetes bacterium]|nr:hypothetical protein [Bacteroidota bacterium]
MLIIKFLVSFLLPFWSISPADHDFKMSVCEVIYSAESESFEVKFYLFTDDLTAALAGDPNAALPARETISNYILKHFDLTVNGGRQALSFESIRQKNDQVLVQFTTPKVAAKSISKMTVKNSVFTEKFRDQTNMVYVIFPGKPKLTQVLDAGDTEGEFVF